MPKAVTIDGQNRAAAVEKPKRPPRIGGKETAAMHRLLKLLEPFDQMARHRILAFVNSYAEELPVQSKLPRADSDDLGF